MNMNYIITNLGKLFHRPFIFDSIFKYKPLIFKSINWKIPILKIPIRIPPKSVKLLNVKNNFQKPVLHKDTLLSKYARYRNWNKASGRYVNQATKIFGNKPHFSFAPISTINEQISMDKIELICKEIRKSLPPPEEDKEKKDLVPLNFSLDNLQLNNQPIVGCDGAVYHAFLKGEQATDENKEGQPKKKKLDPHNLSIKVLFNYSPDTTAPVDVLRGMFQELLPLSSQAIKADDTASSTWLAQRTHLPSHPNVVKILSAFVCPFPTWLPGADQNFQAALPSHCGSPTTLCLLMKRYHCTLDNYLQHWSFPSSRTSLYLLTQLLEALVWLQKHNIAHRDIKPNNIFLEFSQGMLAPQLVLGDFGHAIIGSYDPTGSPGGNPHYMAPEVLQPPGQQLAKVNFSSSDMWSVGALAYLMFGGPCPVEALRQGQEPEPPATMPQPIAALVKWMLQPKPSKRPQSTLAANICQLVLRLPLHSCALSDKLALLTWLVTLKLERFPDQLRDTFLRRIQFPSLWTAANYVRDHS